MSSYKRSASSDLESAPNSPVSRFPSSLTSSPSPPSASSPLFTPPSSSSCSSLFTPPSSPRASRPSQETTDLASAFEEFAQRPVLKHRHANAARSDIVDDERRACQGRCKRKGAFDTDEPNPLGARQDKRSRRLGKGKENALPYRNSTRRIKTILKQTDYSRPAFSSLRGEDPAPQLGECSLVVVPRTPPDPPAPSPVVQDFEMAVMRAELFPGRNDLRTSWIAILVDHSSDTDVGVSLSDELDDDDLFQSQYIAPIPTLAEDVLVLLFATLELGHLDDVVMMESPQAVIDVSADTADTEMEKAPLVLIPLHDASLASIFTRRRHALLQGVYCQQPLAARYAECFSPSWSVREPDKSTTIGRVRPREDDDEVSPHDKRRRLMITPSSLHVRRRKRKKCW